MDDMVNRPKHYTYGAVEVIDIIEQITAGYPPEVAYHIGNLIKYVARAPHKGNLVEDLRKAEWYIRRATNRACRLAPKVDHSDFPLT